MAIINILAEAWILTVVGLFMLFVIVTGALWIIEIPKRRRERKFEHDFWKAVEEHRRRQV